MDRHVVLIGLPGSGKTTVGRLLAVKLGVPFVDLDGRIETATGKTVTQLFQDLGEPMFRMLEQGAMATALEGAPSVIATGGGWAAQPGAVTSVGARGTVLYMRCDPAEAATRLQGDTSRPLLQGRDVTGKLSRLLQQRAGAYEQAVRTFEATGVAPEPLADAIAGFVLYGQVVVGQ
jgi:shikimate kinase